MNIFDIDLELERKVESINNLNNIIDGMECGEVTTTNDEIQAYINDLYVSYTNPIEIPEFVTKCNFGIDIPIEELHNCLLLSLELELVKLTTIEGDLNAKIDSYSYIVKQSAAAAEMAKDEAKRFAERAKSAIAKSDRLKEVLIMILEKYGELGKSGNHTHKTEKFNLWTAHKNSVDIDETVFSTDDKAHYTTVTFKLPTKDYLAFMLLVSENPDVLDTVNLDNLDYNSIKGVTNIDKTALSNRLKQTEVIEGVSFKESTSITIK